MTDIVETDIEATEDRLVILTREVAQLERALASRDMIGQAKGILMERYRITADEAFERLRVASQGLNRKLAALAEQLAATGQWPPET
ncbi:MAG: response regulator with putative antiterminator output domain [Acidimicrobiales bacterium]|nr:response regulator with putative antiterminator output domain [Acidimicrobiales bacterium]